MRRMDLAQLVDEALITYSSVFAKCKQKINKSLTPNVFVDADPDRFSQILNNLLDNAAKYTPVSGTISISLTVNESIAELTIADNGIGISADVLPNIFNLYLQDAAASAFNHNGLGIGLAVVQELTRAHGGGIVAQSEGPGKGSKFVVTLPCVTVDHDDKKHATNANTPITSLPSPAFKNRKTLSMFELQTQVAQDQSQIAALEAQLKNANNELLLNSANLRSANEELVASAMRAQIEAHEASARLQRTTETMNVDMLARSNQNRIDFLARVSHELRTPLNAILGFGQLMLRDDDDLHYLDLAQRERLEGIRLAGQQLLGLTEDILCTKPNRLDIALESVELLDVIGATLTALEEKRRERKVQWQWMFAEPCCTWGDATILQRALHGVIAYALHNCVAGSIVEGSLHQGFNTINILIGYQDSSVSPSISAPPQSELPAAKALLELMEGTLNIHHPMPGVTALQVVLKLNNTHPSSATQLRPLAENLNQEKSAPLHHVLYIEDNPVNAMIMTQIFAKQPQWKFSIATNGAMGLALATSTHPSLILLDIQLGDMSGFQVFNTLKSKNMLPPSGCIALSADALSEHVNEALNAGFTDYWTKPLDIEHLVEKLHMVLKKKN